MSHPYEDGFVEICMIESSGAYRFARDQFSILLEIWQRGVPFLDAETLAGAHVHLKASRIESITDFTADSLQTIARHAREEKQRQLMEDL